MGKRIASARKALGMTQVKLAEQLGISQQTLAHYEVGRLRISVNTLDELAKALDVSIESLVHEQPDTAKGKRGPTPKLQHTIEQVSAMPRAKQKFIVEMLEAMIQQQQAS